MGSLFSLQLGTYYSFLVQARKRKLGLLEEEDDSKLLEDSKKILMILVMLQRPEVCIYLYFPDSLVSLTFQVLTCLCSDHCYFLFSYSIDSSNRAFYRDLVKVIEASNVLLEVLDA